MGLLSEIMTMGWGECLGLMYGIDAWDCKWIALGVVVCKMGGGRPGFVLRLDISLL